MQFQDSQLLPRVMSFGGTGLGIHDAKCGLEVWELSFMHGGVENFFAKIIES